MAKAPKKMANGGPTTSMGGLTSDQIVQQIYANQAARANRGNQPIVTRAQGQPSQMSTAFRQMNDPLALTGGKLTARRALDPLNVLPGNGRSMGHTALDPLGVFGGGGLFGGGRKGNGEMYRTTLRDPAFGPPGRNYHNKPYTPLPTLNNPNPTPVKLDNSAQRTPAGNTGIVPPAAQPTSGPTSLATQAIQQVMPRLPGYADGGKVINRKPNGKGC